MKSLNHKKGSAYAIRTLMHWLIGSPCRALPPTAHCKLSSLSPPHPALLSMVVIQFANLFGDLYNLLCSTVN